MAVALERELETFRGLLPTLMKDEGKFALIIGEGLAGIFESRGDALLTGYQKTNFGPFLVKKISGSEPVLRFSRDIRGEWLTSPPSSTGTDRPHRPRSE